MPAETFSQLADSDWVQISTGGPFGVQVLGPGGLALYMGSSTPDENETEVLFISVGGDKSFSIDPEGAGAWVRCYQPDQVSNFRGWRIV